MNENSVYMKIGKVFPKIGCSAQSMENIMYVQIGVHGI